MICTIRASRIPRVATCLQRRISSGATFLVSRCGETGSSVYGDGLTVDKTPKRAKSKLNKTIVNFWLDAFLLMLFTVVLLVTAIVRFVFPAGTAADGWTLAGWSYDQWVDVQTVAISLLALGVLVHVMLHWTWVCGVIASRLSRKRDKKAKIEDGTRTLWGVGLLIILVHVIGIGIAVAVLTIQGPVE